MHIIVMERSSIVFVIRGIRFLTTESIHVTAHHLVQNSARERERERSSTSSNPRLLASFRKEGLSQEEGYDKKKKGVGGGVTLEDEAVRLLLTTA